MAKGDHICVNRYGGAYGHHGIDCGDGTVIHYSGKSWASARIVRRTALAEFTQGEDYQIRDYSTFYEAVSSSGSLYHRANFQLSRLFNELQGIKLEEIDTSADAVVARAESRIGEQAFNVILHNCEHFATWCKTGINNSEQVNLMLQALIYNAELSRFPPHKLLLGAQELLLDFLETKSRR